VLGQTALIRAGVGVVGLIWMILALRSRAQPRGLLFASALALAAYATLTRTSHLYAMRSGLAGIGSDFAHLIGGAVWVGGLCGLLIAARQAQRLTEDRSAVAATAALLRRFTPLGIFGAVLIVGTGLASSAFMLPNQTALTQPYGRLVLVKVALVVVALGFASGHRWLAPRWMRSRAQAALIQKTLLLETLITLGAFAAAAWLTSSMPPQHAMSHIMADGSTMQMEVADPDFQILLIRAAAVTLIAGTSALALELRSRAAQ
jgi:putative copper export protein